MKYLGDFPLAGVVYFCFNTQQSDGTPITLAGTPAVAVYKNDTATPLTLSPAPVLTVGFNSVVGLHNVKIDLADADFVAGDYSVVISAGTVDGVSVVGRVLAQFSIENRVSNVTAINSDKQSVIDLKDFADAGYDPSTNKVQGLVLADAVTTVNGIADNAITAAAIATNAIDADSLAADAASEIADAVWDEASTGHTDAGKAGAQLWTDVDAILADTGTDGVVVNAHTVAAKAEIEAEATDALNAYDPPTRAEATTDANAIITQVDANETKIDTVDTVVDAIKAQTDKLAFAGTGPYDVKATLDSETVTLASATHTGAVIPTVTAVTNDVGITQAGADKVWGSAARTLTSFGTLVTDIWAAGTRTLTGFGTLVADIWGAATSGLTTVGSIGKLIVDYLDAAISSRLASVGYTAPDNATIATIQSDTNDIQSRLPAALVGGRMDASVGAMANDVVTSDALAAEAVTEIQTGLATSANQTAILNRLGNFAGSGLNTVLGFLRAMMRKDASLTPSDVGGTFDNTTDSLEAQQESSGGSYPTVDEIIDGVLDVAAGDHNLPGTIGERINDAGGAADPLTNAVPGDYAAGSAGKLIGDKLGLIGAAEITVVSPVTEIGEITIVAGDDYSDDDGRAISWTSDDWPDLTGGAVEMSSRGVTHDCTIVTAGSGINQEVRMELTSETTESMPRGARSYTLIGTLANGHVVTLATGTMTVE